MNPLAIVALAIGGLFFWKKYEANRANAGRETHPVTGNVETTPDHVATATDAAASAGSIIDTNGVAVPAQTNNVQVI